MKKIIDNIVMVLGTFVVLLIEIFHEDEGVDIYKDEF